MYLKSLELVGFKSFGKKSALEFSTPITAIVGPNGSGKSNTAEAFRFVLGEQSMKGLRSKRGEDLIWGGSSEVSRSNRASVKAVFDNTKRLLDVDFDEVVIERTVFRDGTNEYLINGSKVRLKDITSLLAGANIGSSGHHIISQGEADRVLAASPRDRKSMIEDALGLRVYQYKKDESLKKLEKTEENKAQVESLRRENAPHLRFLERQVKKIEKARELRTNLVASYQEYLYREDRYLDIESESIDGLREEPLHEKKKIEARIGNIRETLEKEKENDKETKALLELEKILQTLRSEQAEHARTIGRIEGQITFEERRLEQEKNRASEEEGQSVPYKEARKFWEDLTRIFDHAHDQEEDINTLRLALKQAQKTLRKFVEKHVATREKYVPDTDELERLQTEKTQAAASVERVERLVQEQEQKKRALSVDIEKGKDDNRELERELFTLMTKQTELRSTLASLEDRELRLQREQEEFKREVGEGVALIGRQVQGYKDFASSGNGEVDIDNAEEDRNVQLERRRALEKLKIRLEEVGGGAVEDITKEHAEVKERDEFLANELADLEKSAEALRALIADLERELGEKFAAGVAEVSKQFNNFFALMFGGGSASLKVSAEKRRSKLTEMVLGSGKENPDDEDESEAGVDIEVSLPKKRIQSLMMLSGGERALTSIALIFAMSQVNPPPFLILDETDAALDEANSRRYGEMIIKLSQKSQLILITHNRETMSCAGILYGITMGIDGVSRILSVKLDDAVAVAK